MTRISAPLAAPYLDKKYASLLSPKLERFKWKSPDEAQFRCPICGDSKKNKYKCRGGFFYHKGQLMMGCFNCGYYAPFNAFLKNFDPVLYQEYVMEKMKNKKTEQRIEKIHEKQSEKLTGDSNTNLKALDKLVKISDLPADHFACQYVRERRIPFEFYNILYYSDNYQKWLHDEVDPKVKDCFDKDERIVIPFFARENVPFAFQGRYIGNEPDKRLRYATANPIEGNLLLYGLERLQNGKPMHVLEGPIDSLFIPNAVAAAGSSLGKLLKYKNLDAIFIFDNEPYSPEICKLMEKVIDADKKIVIWPFNVTQKDINLMVLAGLNPLDIVEKNVYSGLIAKMKFNEWKKI